MHLPFHRIDIVYQGCKARKKASHSVSPRLGHRYCSARLRTNEPSPCLARKLPKAGGISLILASNLPQNSTSTLCSKMYISEMPSPGFTPRTCRSFRNGRWTRKHRATATSSHYGQYRLARWDPLTRALTTMINVSMIEKPFSHIEYPSNRGMNQAKTFQAPGSRSGTPRGGLQFVSVLPKVHLNFGCTGAPTGF